MRIFEEKIASYRNFNNKLWNIARYIEDKVGEEAVLSSPDPSYHADFWILNKLHEATQEVTRLLENYELGQAFDTLYHFVWDDFADWYLEVSKSQPNISVLTYVLEVVLKLAHPFAPFVTETIWDTLNWEEGLLITSPWPKTKSVNKGHAADFEEIMTIVKEIRHLRAEMGINENTLYFISADFLEDNAELLSKLGGLRGVKKVSSGKGLHLTRTKYDAWVDIEEQKANDYMYKLISRREDSKKLADRLTKRLGDKKYTTGAPKDVVDETRANLASHKEILTRLDKEIDALEHAMKRVSD